MNDVRSYVCSNEITVYILAKTARYTLDYPLLFVEEIIVAGPSHCSCCEKSIIL